MRRCLCTQCDGVTVAPFYSNVFHQNLPLPFLNVPFCVRVYMLLTYFQLCCRAFLETYTQTRTCMRGASFQSACVYVCVCTFFAVFYATVSRIRRVVVCSYRRLLHTCRRQIGERETNPPLHTYGYISGTEWKALAVSDSFTFSVPALACGRVCLRSVGVILRIAGPNCHFAAHSEFLHALVKHGPQIIQGGNLDGFHSRVIV